MTKLTLRTDGATSWVTVASPRASRARIARRVGSARAAKVASRCSALIVDNLSVP